MCGIVAYINRVKLDGNRMLDAIAHRGPDACGTYSTSAGSSDVFIGHRRLKIIDLSEEAAQPMISRNGRYVISYNGEIYNYKALRDKYLNDVEMRSSGDTEVLLNMWEKYGCESIKMLNGDYAFCVWDEQELTLSIVRDIAGVKPLYYYVSSDGILVGSELSVFIMSGITVKENLAALKSYFVFKYYPGCETPISGVYRVPQGHYMEYKVSTGNLSMRSYWSKENVDLECSYDYRDSVLVLREKIATSVRSRLMADVPVGNFISGGVDSSGIAYFMRDVPGMLHHCARKSDSDLRLEGTSSDAHYAARLAEDWGLDVRYYDIGYDDRIEEMIRTTIRYSDDLIADGSQIPSYLITSAASHHSTVLLSGMGADELFLGYGGHILTLLSQYLDRMPSFVSRRIAAVLSQLQTGHGKYKGNKRFLKKLGAYQHRGVSKYGLFSIVGDYDRSSAIILDDSEPLNHISKYFTMTDDPFEGLSHFEYENFLVKNLHYLDRMCMANSVEGRVPYLDPEIISFALALPREYKLTGFGKSKRILKDALRGLIPDYILNRRKAGFGMPLRSMFMNEGRTRGLLNMEFFRERPIFNIPHIEQLLAEHVRGLNDNSSMLYALISYRIWHEEVFKNRAA